ncbi:arginine--tRNA ligase [Pseudalkalibacillus decolorationis]|uniref:arginine--tRNA ligase n=1 Tax=Pseudalkalibacillus decolorationis TaxID=163879 RepID=UPI002148AF1C|nr:arginine--tRNA ligase [Pseudalkalibacillus decolorationis]
MNIVEQVKEKLKIEIGEAVVKAGLVSKEEMPEVILELPKNKDHGDYATNMAMQLARIAKKAPRQIAEELVAHFDRSKASIEKIEVAGPGFINFYLDNHYLTGLIPAIIQSAEEYGSTNVGNNKKVQIEFVSANPTGSLHLGHARGAAVGDTLCNILEKAGYRVSREYYINDAGNQIHNLALSIESRYLEQLGKEAPMPEDGYFGKDIIGFAKEIVDKDGDKYLELNQEERLRFFREFGLKKELEKIEDDLADFRVEFDEWYSETSLYTSGKIDTALELLNEKGVTYEKDAATWFRTSDFGDDKDRVLIKNDGTYTYLTPDIAYHYDKLQRGFETVINIWGADHHGYIPRMKAAFEALGYNREQLEIQIIQLVSLFQNGQKVKMSKRTGKAVTLRDLMEEVGIDATRYFFAMRSSDSHLDFDMDLAVSRSNENPVYYVQYAHARVCSMLRQGKEKGYSFDDVDLSSIRSEKEYDLLKKLGEFPEAIAEAAHTLTTHRITNYVYELASTLHSFYNAERVLDDENPQQSQARFALMKAVQHTLENGLKLIGVSAPEKM